MRVRRPSAADLVAGAMGLLGLILGPLLISEASHPRNELVFWLGWIWVFTGICILGAIAGRIRR